MESNRFSLAGKVAVVTGGGRGIGRAIAIAIAVAGARVVAVSRSQEQLSTVVGEIEAQGGHGLALTADIGRVEDVETMVQQTVETFGRIDVLVNAAGISPFYTRAEKLTPEMWDSLMAVNLRGTFLCCQAAGKIMLTQKGGGSIINVSSAGGVVALPRLAAYCAAKGGVIMLTKTLAVEWAPRNVRVNAIAPGWVATDMTLGLRDNEGVLKGILDTIPMERMGTPEEIAGAAVYLASDASSFVTGSVLAVDGGATAH